MNTAFFARIFQRVRPASHLMVKVLPWLSMSWGVASGLVISRRFDVAPRVLVFAVALLLVSILLGVWSRWSEKQLENAPERVAENAQGNPTGDNPLGLPDAKAHGLLKQQARIDWLLVTGTQVFSQYLLMFSLTFLYWTGAWVYLGFAVVLVVSTLWDPLFFRLVKFYPYRLVLRTTALVFAISFLVGALLPAFLPLFGVFSLAGAFWGAFPWRFFQGRLHTARQRVWAVVPLVLVGVATLAHSSFGGLFRFPVLSIWVKKGAFVLQDAQGFWRGTNASRDFGLLRRGSVLQLDEVTSALREGGRLCCVSPVVAPRALQSAVVHEWWYGSRKLETIPLPPLQGRDEGFAYRTYSCKKYLPFELTEAAESAEATGRNASLRCRVFLGHDEQSRLEVGTVHLTLESQTLGKIDASGGLSKMP